MTGPVGAAASLAAAGDAMQGIIDSANKGQFRVTPEAGDELIKIFQEMEDHGLPKMQRRLARLRRRTPLGDSPAGQTIADFNQQVAIGDDGKSFADLLQQFQERVPQVIEAIKKGIQLYHEVDEGNAGFRGVQR